MLLGEEIFFWLSNEGIREGYPSKKSSYFITIDSSSIKTIADRDRLAADELSEGTNIDDFE